MKCEQCGDPVAITVHPPEGEAGKEPVSLCLLCALKALAPMVIHLIDSMAEALPEQMRGAVIGQVIEAVRQGHGDVLGVGGVMVMVVGDENDDDEPRPRPEPEPETPTATYNGPTGFCGYL